MKKNFVLDTNVLLHDPQAIYAFEDNNVIIPIYCIEEIDQFKKDISELGRNARQVSRYLDEFRLKGHLADGVPINDNNGSGVIQVLWTERNVPIHLRNNRLADNKILAVALEVANKDSSIPTIFVTKDTNLRIRADALNLKAENYESDRIDIRELYSGTAELLLPSEQIDTIFREGFLEYEDEELSANQCILLRDNTAETHTALGRYRREEKKITLISPASKGTFGVTPRNKEQTFALELLLSDDIKLVTLVGKAGTGKTLLAIAAGLKKTADEHTYQRLLVSRPIFPLGRDIGFLPGAIEDKLNPWMQPIFDNVELIYSMSNADRRSGRSYHELIDLGIIEIEPLTYIRGRSIPNQYIIVDEAQNLTPHEVKTIITRVGEKTKIVLTGDHYQIDNPYVDSSSNGLTYVVNRFRNHGIAGHITLEKGERSALAELATNLL